MIRNPILIAVALLAALGSLRAVQASVSPCPTWSYSNTTLWGFLCPQYELCRLGSRQSPIALTTSGSSSVTTQVSLSTPGYSSTRTFLNDGHTVEVNFNTGTTSTFTFPNVDAPSYLRQFHFHKPAEHTVDGIQAELEVHFVTSNDNGDLAVFAVMFNGTSSTENSFLTALTPLLPSIQATGSKVDVNLPALTNLFNSAMSTGKVFIYDGGLTVPPCGEDVVFHVLSDVQSATAAQIAAFSVISNSNRPVQPLNGRTIVFNSNGVATTTTAASSASEVSSAISSLLFW